MNVVLPGTLQMILGLYGYLLPLLLYVAWSTLALWDLGRRESISTPAVWGWTFAIFLLPFVGALACLWMGKSTITPRNRWVTVGAGAAAYLVLLLLGASIGGIS